VFSLANVFTSLLFQVRESHKQFYNRAVDVPHPSTPTAPCWMSMHLHILLRITTNNTQIYAHIQIPSHNPCDPRHAHAPPSLADEPTCVRFWRPCADSNIRYVIFKFYSVMSYPVTYSVSFVERGLDCTRWLVRVVLVENFFIYIPQQTTKTVRIWCSAACHGVIAPIKS
jgi:hypothetical protein